MSAIGVGNRLDWPASSHGSLLNIRLSLKETWSKTTALVAGTHHFTFSGLVSGQSYEVELRSLSGAREPKIAVGTPL